MMKRTLYIFLAALAFQSPLKAQQLYTLEECRQMALEQNAKMKVAANKTQMAKQEKREAATNFFPSITLTGGAMKADDGLIQMPREFVLLQGMGCKWKKCTFCDYHEDVSNNPYEVNEPVLRQVTGQYGVLDVINSGSAMELDDKTIELIKEVVKEKQIHTLWLEAHYMYRKKLTEFAKQFAPAKVKFRCGVETFDANLRDRWKKGIPSSVTPEDIGEYFQGVCLLLGTEGETKEHVMSDIEIAKKHFEYFSVNVFCNNSTQVKQDKELAQWFAHEIYPRIKDEDGIEVLMENTDLGVG